MRRYDLADDLAHDSVIGELAEGAWRLVVRHRGIVLTGLAAMAIVAYTSANALYLQDGAHPSAFFETRNLAEARRHALRTDQRTPAAPTDVTRIVFDAAGDGVSPGVSIPEPSRRPASQTVKTEATVETIIAAPEPVTGDADPIVELQSMLASLGFYEAEIDGLKGPRTQAAVEAYKVSVGLRGIDLSIDELLTSLRNNMMVTAAIPRQRPEEGEAVPAPAITPAPPSDRRIGAAAQAPVADPAVLRVQAGLKAFGNEHIGVDGVAGAETRMAIREFQSLFRLPVTGEIDEALVEKMVAVGLID